MKRSQKPKELTPQQKLLAAVVLDEENISDITKKMGEEPGDALIPFIKGDLDMLSLQSDREKWANEVIDFLQRHGAPKLNREVLDTDEKNKAVNLGVEIDGKPKNPTYTREEIDGVARALEALRVEAEKNHQRINAAWVSGHLGA